MTSDKQVHRVRVADIIMSERQRKDYGDIDGLANSIDDLELLQPITVTRPTEIDPKPKPVIGGRRLRAHILRRIEFIDCLFTHETDPIKLMKMEWAENDQRKDYTWQERLHAIVEMHKELKARHGRSWTRKQTAKDINYSPALVSQYLGIDELSKDHPEIMKAADLGAARTMMKKISDRDADAEDEVVDEICSEVIDGHKVTAKSEIPIITADFCEWAPAYTGPKFNFLHCDFPYGIDTDKRNMGNAIDVHGGYDDSFENYRRLLEALCTNLDRICTDSAQIMFWFSMRHYAYTLKFFEDHSNFKIEPHPLIWVKPGTGILPDRMHGPRRIYETCLFGRRGGRVTAASVDNAYVGGIDRSADHASVKSEVMLRHFFRMFVDENSKVLDPTCGSGTALRAAKSLGAKYVLGIEKDKDFAERATRAFKNWLVANGPELMPDRGTA